MSFEHNLIINANNIIELYNNNKINTDFNDNSLMIAYSSEYIYKFSTVRYNNEYYDIYVFDSYMMLLNIQFNNKLPKKQNDFMKYLHDYGFSLLYNNILRIYVLDTQNMNKIIYIRCKTRIKNNRNILFFFGPSLVTDEVTVPIHNVPNNPIVNQVK